MFFLIAACLRPALARAGRGCASRSGLPNQVVDREHVPGVITVAPKDDVRPAVHAGRRVPVAADPAWALRDRVDEHALVARSEAARGR